MIHDKLDKSEIFVLHSGKEQLRKCAEFFVQNVLHETNGRFESRNKPAAVTWNLRNVPQYIDHTCSGEVSCSTT